MDRVRDYLNWNVIIWLVLFVGVFIIFGCSTTEDSSTETLLTDSTDLETFTFTVDATSREVWTYFSFKTGDVVQVADAANSEVWDIGFQRTSVKLNGGNSGPGKGSMVMLTETKFEDVAVAPEAGYLSDSEDTLAILPQSEKGWYIYTGPPTHWVLPLEDRVFVIKAADSTFSKVRFVGYYKDNANKVDSGFVTFEYVHQPNGSRNF